MFKQQIRFSWSWQVSALPPEIWPFISDTNRLFKDIRQPSIRETDITQTVKPGFAQLSYNGINRYEVWEEEPYEWEYPFRFGVIRHYKSGPYKDLKIQVDLNPNKRGTRLQLSLWASPRLSIISGLATLKLKTVLKRRIKNTIRQYDKLALQHKKAYHLSNTEHLVRGGQKRLHQIREQLHNNEVDARILEKVIEYIKREDDLDLKRIQPYELADYWALDRKDVLKVFIQAAKAGLLNFNWDLYCPECRSIQQSVKTLSQIHEPVFCDDCEDEFSINFNKTIQLSFTPHPLIRKVEKQLYCNRGPQANSHIYIQQYLAPGEKRFLKTELPEGKYILQASKSRGSVQITIEKGGKETVHVTLAEKGFNGEQVALCSDPNLSLGNSSDQPQLFTIKRKKWNKIGVSAAEATSSQLFRDLFSDEVLRRGEKISADNLTLMFTDLFDSTGLYNKEGDDRALGKVIDHFEILQKAVGKHHGAIVKTIGDSVMAVFCQPDHAFKAYLEAQLLLASDEKFKNNLQIKAGIHHGSCVAVNLNSRIDYFGSTVNIASRFVDHATENEVVISENTFSEAGLEAILNDFSDHNTIKNISTQLKGFESESFTIKRIKIDNSPLRLVV